MKLVLLVGSGAVGKMTVGQALAKITGLKLFHNHMAIEPVIELFGTYNHRVVEEIRESIFREFAASDQYGLIFTYMWAFDMQEDWDYIAHVQEIFAPYNTEVYCVELVASQEVRLARNATENRLRHKKSKQDVEASNRRLQTEDANYRLVSREGELPFEHYLRLDNTALSPEEAAAIIKERFNL